VVRTGQGHNDGVGDSVKNKLAVGHGQDQGQSISAKAHSTVVEQNSQHHQHTVTQIQEKIQEGLLVSRQQKRKSYTITSTGAAGGIGLDY
jgi:hypothetical protein